MDLQTRKLDFIQDFLKYANTSILEKFGEMLRQEREKEFKQEIKPMTLKHNLDLIENLKSSENYKSFKNITLNDKKEHEEEARLILEKFHGNFNHSHFKEIIKLVDGPYPYEFNGKKVATGKWFGNLLNTPNTEYFFKTDINPHYF